MAKRWAVALMRLLGRNWITLFGASLTTVSGLAICAFLLFGLLGLADSPYLAMMALLVLPAFFVLGLILIPVGAYVDNRRRRAAGNSSQEDHRRDSYPKVDFNKPSVRRAAAAAGFLTVINVFLVSAVSFQGVSYMDTPEFCGEVCHSVMQPEFDAYKDSPHARVACVDCHIGPGAPWFVRSKISGMGQMLAVTFDTYQRPIPTPVENLRPSQDTCEQCHWPAKFTGDRIKVIRKYSDDEANTPLTTALLLHIGGGDQGGSGIHSWHIDPSKQTTYVSLDPQRQTIAWVEVREADGSLTEYFARGQAPTEEQRAQGVRRIMDCIDCHNRPTHIMHLPGRALDQAITEGRVDRSIPFIKKMGVQVLTQVGQVLAAPEQIAQQLRDYYQKNHFEFYNSQRAMVEDAIREIQSIYSRNVFPQMRVSWGTYPDNIGHEYFPGCFRCHDGDHTTLDGSRSIEQDCTSCHTVLAWDEESPAVLSDLGIR